MKYQISYCRECGTQNEIIFHGEQKQCPDKHYRSACYSTITGEPFFIIQTICSKYKKWRDGNIQTITSSFISCRNSSISSFYDLTEKEYKQNIKSFFK